MSKYQKFFNILNRIEFCRARISTKIFKKYWAMVLGCILETSHGSQWYDPRFWINKFSNATRYKKIINILNTI